MTDPRALPDQGKRVLAGDRVYVTARTSFTHPGPGTVVGVDRTSPRPIRVTLDGAAEPFDLMDLRDDEVESLASDEEHHA